MRTGKSIYLSIYGSGVAWKTTTLFSGSSVGDQETEKFFFVSELILWVLIRNEGDKGV